TCAHTPLHPPLHPVPTTPRAARARRRRGLDAMTTRPPTASLLAAQRLAGPSSNDQEAQDASLDAVTPTQALRSAPSLIHTPHALEEQRLRARLDHLGVRLEVRIEVERPVGQAQHGAEGLFAAQSAPHR